MFKSFRQISKELGFGMGTFRQWVLVSGLPYTKGFGKKGGLYLSDEQLEKLLKMMEKRGK